MLLDREESRISLTLPANSLQCAFIGRVTQIKRPDRFLDVVNEIKKRGVKLDFLIAGDGELLEMCRERIKQQDLPVTILGWQSDIERVLSSTDMVVLTSDNEGTPLSLIQAGMAGLPVVTTNVGSVPEVVLDGLTGIVTGLDVQKIADALENLANDKILRTKLGVAAQEFTMTNFGVKRLVHDHEELYKKLLSSRAKSYPIVLASIWARLSCPCPHQPYDCQ
jgi:glycosyltransferase involved in cell wall biosynthesis